ncbi:MAG: hypothetical protein KR126chlam1_00504 [Chlamydiae bacterium]|nr:hypothetical protein [Chlamydiota bacterium]
MKMDIKSKLPVAALAFMGIASVATAANCSHNSGERCSKCETLPAANCYKEECECYYCLGPDLVNPSVNPRTCEGDIAVTVAGFYWNSHQCGLEYAVQNAVHIPKGASSCSELQELNTLIDAKYLNPKFDWDFGFKFGLAYAGCHDGWDLGVTWTWYKGHASTHVETESDDNQVLIPLWTGFAPSIGNTTYATDIQTEWKLKLNLVDIELGREFWTSRYLTMRPHVGIRIASIKQDYDLQHKGGSWSARTGTNINQDAYNNLVELDNDFHGAGVRAGLDTIWNLGCGFGVYGNLALSIIYGRFTIEHDETNRLAHGGHTKMKYIDTKNSFRASRAMADLALGFQWSTMFCDCCYAFTAMLGWEHHLFFDQNQLWRVVRIGDTQQDVTPSCGNNTGENVFYERRGDLDTQGWTLTFKFEF